MLKLLVKNYKNVLKKLPEKIIKRKFHMIKLIIMRWFVIKQQMNKTNNKEIKRIFQDGSNFTKLIFQLKTNLNKMGKLITNAHE